MISKKRVLITGSNGLLGQKLIALLLPMPDVEVIATARGSNRMSAHFPGLTKYSPLDISNRSEVLDVIGRYKPDHVIHAAAMTNVDQCETEREMCWQINVEGTRHIIEACTVHNAHLVHVSTDFIFDGSSGPYKETALPCPVNFYGESKVAAEKLVQESALKWAIARTVLVYGTLHDGSRSNIVLWVKNSLEEGKSLKLVNDQLRSPTLAEDLAMGCWLIAKNNATGIYNISGKDLLTPYEMAIKVAEVFDLDKTLIEKTDSTQFKQPARRPARTGFILTKAQTELGYAPHSFKEGIEIVAGQVVNTTV